MSYFSEEEQKFLNRFNFDRPFLTKFLNLHEQNLLKSINNELLFDGGFPEAEAKRAMFKLEVSNISCIKIDYNKKYYNLTHRDVLGSVLGLKISRNMIGDIVIAEDIYMLVCSEIEGLLLSELTKIKNANVKLEVVSSSFIKLVDNSKKLTIFVKSLRIDLLVAHVFNISRNEVKELFLSEKIKVDSKIITNHALVLNNEQVVSVRGFGRFTVLSTGRVSKSNNLVIEVKVYK